MKRSDYIAPLLVTVMLGCGSVFVMQGVWVHAKAAVGQWLIERAWDKRADDGAQRKPWPWADFFPVAKLKLSSVDAPLFVLDKVSGEALAFGPGMQVYLDDETHAPLFVIQAHNDTHFASLNQLAIGDELSLITKEKSFRFTVTKHKTLRNPHFEVASGVATARLLLSTCADTAPNQPSRHIVFASAP